MWPLLDSFQKVPGQGTTKRLPSGQPVPLGDLLLFEETIEKPAEKPIAGYTGLLDNPETHLNLEAFNSLGRRFKSKIDGNSTTL